jgi:phage terminase large subunit-like protein
MALTKLEKVQLITLLEEKKKREKGRKLSNNYKSLYEWQRRFIAATADNRSCMLMAANRVGKTRTGLVVDAIHLTGEYPDDWQGHRFSHAPRCWLLGYSMEKTRDLLQMELFGRMEGGEFAGGLIPKEKIVGWLSATGTSGAMREVRVKHSSGFESICQFWSYSQGQHALMGDSVDFYHIDEEPRDKAIFPQVLTRTATGDKGKGGRGILTFTPENGRTELVVQFMDNPGDGQYMQRATWDDALHLTEETKTQLLNSFPEWQRDMRTKGLPLLGSGLIYDIGDNQVKVQPFECPPHWWVIDGMDFGFDHPQAHIQLWWDKDADTFYLAHAWKKSRALPPEAWSSVKSWAKDVPTAWPMDGLQTEKGSGKQQKSYYAEEGFNMIHAHATWQDGGNGVEAGILELYRLMQEGRFKAFAHISDFFDEKMNYHRDESGKIVKTSDDLLDAIRYAYMMRRYAVQKSSIGQETFTDLEFKSLW